MKTTSLIHCDYNHRSEEEVNKIIDVLMLTEGEEAINDAIFYGGLVQLLAEGEEKDVVMTVADALHQAYQNI